MSGSILQNKYILVVEDNTINQMLVKHTLQKTGAIVDIAEDGHVALELIKKKVPYLILMDLQLPEMDGFEITRIIRNELKLDVPVIAMSAMMFLGEEQKCVEAGMNGHMMKPFSMEVFYETIGKVMQTEAVAETTTIIKSEGLTLDLTVLYNLGSSDKSYLKLVVQTFLDSMAGVMQKLAAAHEANDLDTLMRTAHFAKSSLSVIKVNEMFDVMQHLELSCKNNRDLDTIPEKLEWLKKNYPKAETLLRKTFDLPLTSDPITA